MLRLIQRHHTSQPATGLTQRVAPHPRHDSFRITTPHNRAWGPRNDWPLLYATTHAAAPHSTTGHGSHATSGPSFTPRLIPHHHIPQPRTGSRNDWPLLYATTH